MSWSQTLRWLGGLCIAAGTVYFVERLALGLLSSFSGPSKQVLLTSRLLVQNLYALSEAISIGLIALFFSGIRATLARTLAGCACILLSLVLVCVPLASDARFYMLLVGNGSTKLLVFILSQAVGIASKGLALGLITIALGREGTLNREPAHASR